MLAISFQILHWNSSYKYQHHRQVIWHPWLNTTHQATWHRPVEESSRLPLMLGPTTWTVDVTTWLLADWSGISPSLYPSTYQQPFPHIPYKYIWITLNNELSSAPATTWLGDGETPFQTKRRETKRTDAGTKHYSRRKKVRLWLCDGKPQLLITVQKKPSLLISKHDSVLPKRDEWNYNTILYKHWLAAPLPYSERNHSSETLSTSWMPAMDMQAIKKIEAWDSTNYERAIKKVK